MAKGRKTGGGSRKGRSNRTTAKLCEAILRAFDNVGGSAYLVKLAKNNPGVFAMLLAKILPTNIAGDPDGKPIIVEVVTGISRAPNEPAVD